MNVDGCYHVPTAPGQSMCQHMDYIMWLRFCLEVQAEVIKDLSKQAHPVGGLRYVRDTTGKTTVLLDLTPVEG